MAEITDIDAYTPERFSDFTPVQIDFLRRLTNEHLEQLAQTSKVDLAQFQKLRDLCRQTFLVGEIANYKEAEAEFKVEVIKSECDLVKESYRLKILEVITPFYPESPEDVGEEITCFTTRAHPEFKSWSLSKEE